MQEQALKIVLVFPLFERVLGDEIRAQLGLKPIVRTLG